MKSSLRVQLVLGTWLLLVVAFLPPFFYVSNTLRNDITTEARTRALAVMASTRWMLSSQYDIVDVPTFTTWAKEFSEHMGARFSYIVNGKVFVDTTMTDEELHAFNDHSLRPEIMTANEKGQGIALRYSTTVKYNYIYIAEPLRDFNGLADGIIRVALPVTDDYVLFSRIETGLFFAFFASLVASAFLGFFVTRPFLASIDDLATTAQGIGQGDYSRRIRAISTRELRPLACAINGMAHNIETHLYSLEEQKRRLEAVFNGMSEGVMVLDAQGCITTTNRAFSSMLQKVTDMIGRSPLEVTMRPSLQQAVDLVRVQSSMQAQTLLLPCSNERVFEVNLVPFMDASGRCVVLVFHDVSEKEKLERMRRDFVANVSHELKTPLTSIKGYAEALTELPNQPPQQRALFLETIARNADHMTKMVNSLLTLAKSEHMGEQKNLAIIDACQVLDDCFDAMQPSAASKDITILADYEEGLFIRAEADGLAEVFHNLLDNAIKYSPIGTTVRLRAKLEKVTNQRRGSSYDKVYLRQKTHMFDVVFCVQDQGAGIPEKSKMRIFERFFRLEGESSKDGSAGLGLAICRRIVKSYGGEIWVESPTDVSNGNGAAFCVSIPFSHEAKLGDVSCVEEGL